MKETVLTILRVVLSVIVLVVGTLISFAILHHFPSINFLVNTGVGIAAAMTFYQAFPLIFKTQREVQTVSPDLAYGAKARAAYIKSKASVGRPFNGINLVSLSFDRKGFKEVVREPQFIKWKDEAGDTVSQEFFALPPNLPFPLEDIDSLRQAYQQLATKDGVGLVSLEVQTIAGIKCVEWIFKCPRASRGMDYFGGIIVPRSDFSFGINMFCEEGSPTGLRDSLVSAKLRRDNPDVDVRAHWFFDPYNPNNRQGVLVNLSESEEYDEDFYFHPLSRLRHFLRVTLPNTMRLDGRVLEAATF